MNSMDSAELVKQPQDVTENPYRKSRKEAQKAKLLLGAEVLYVLPFVYVICFLPLGKKRPRASTRQEMQNSI